MKKLKRQLISDVQNLDMNSKIEFFNYMVSYNIAFMENINGVFFSIADISDEILDKLFEKLEILQKFQIYKNNSNQLVLKNDYENTINENTLNEKLVNITKNEEDIYDKNENNKEIFTKTVINDYNDILKDMESKTNKMNKKHSIYIKYSIV